MKPHRTNRRGFLFIDVAFGLALLGLVAAALITTMGRQQRAAQKLSDDRAATRLAEDALTSLRLGQPPAKSEEADVRVTRLPDAAPAGYAWVRVAVQVSTSRATVVGVVPAAIVPVQEEAKP